jgi:hypothetical protein
MRPENRPTTAARLQENLTIVNTLPAWATENRGVKFERKNTAVLRKHLDDLDVVHSNVREEFNSALDPRAFATPEEWRDLVKIQLNLKKLKTDWNSVELCYPDPKYNPSDEDSSENISLIAYNFEDASSTVPWKTVQETFGREKSSSFKYRLRILDESEECATEYEGLPSWLWTRPPEPKSNDNALQSSSKAPDEAPSDGTVLEASQNTEQGNIEDSILQSMSELIRRPLGPDHKAWLAAHDPNELFKNQPREDVIKDHYTHQIFTEAGRVTYRADMINHCIPQKITTDKTVIDYSKSLSADDKEHIEEFDAMTREHYVHTQKVIAACCIVSQC